MNSEKAVKTISEIIKYLSGKDEVDDFLVARLFPFFRHYKKIISDFKYMSEELNKAREAWEFIANAAFEEDPENALKLNKALWIDSRPIKLTKREEEYAKSLLAAIDMCKLCGGTGMQSLSEWSSHKVTCTKCNGTGKEKIKHHLDHEDEKAK